MTHGRSWFERILRSLFRDTAANTIVIAAAAMVPLMAMVGGGVDASRYYITASRMQAACDAGALAPRRAMTDDTFTTAHRTIGLNFYDQSFSNGMFGLVNGTRNYTSDGEGTAVIFVEVAYDYRSLTPFQAYNGNTITYTAAFNIRDSRDLAQLLRRWSDGGV